MRRLADEARIRDFMGSLAATAGTDTTCYFTGGATAVLLGWRSSTIDVDIRLEPEHDDVMRALPMLKDELQINVELASPLDFVPVPAGWEDRSVFVSRDGHMTFLHLDPYAQALSKLERAHVQDLEDVAALVELGLVEPARARAYFEEIEPELYRFPAIDPPSFRRRVEEAFA